MMKGSTRSFTPSGVMTSQLYSDEYRIFIYNPYSNTRYYLTALDWARRMRTDWFSGRKTRVRVRARSKP